MKAIHKIFPDERFSGLCSYCGSKSENRDHTPSKILLNEPYPDNIPVVPACVKCNNGFSIDEEYVACILDCILNGSTSFTSSISEKTKRAFNHSPALQSLINNSRIENSEGIFWQIDDIRLKNVLLKLARGHAVYENTEQQLYDPISINYIPLIYMEEDDRLNFETRWNYITLLPEVGSRGLIKKIGQGDFGWQIVQQDIYRYTVLHTENGLLVQLVLKEYLACEVLWE